MVNPETKGVDVQKCVRQCVECRSIDPSPTNHQSGSLSVGENWCRLALDVTKYRGQSYLTIIDSGPCRYAMWRKIRSENADDIATAINDVFLERGPVEELLLDNSAAFRSSMLAALCDRWGVRLRFRAAYRPSGNGIAERHHRTIKRMAERCRASPHEVLFWYNMAPADSNDMNSSPAYGLFKYQWRHPLIKKEFREEDSGIWRIGDEVWVKPPGARCTTRWDRGKITGVTSRNNIEVNGMPRHVLDIRRVFDESDDETSSTRSEEESDVSEVSTENGSRDFEAEVVPRRSTREKRRPVWLNDYV